MKLIARYLEAGCGADKELATLWLPHIQHACDTFEIDTRLRVAGFLSSLGAESLALTHTEEDLNYSALDLLREFPNVFGLQEVVDYEHVPVRIANHVYGGRLGNGTEASGDGWRYRGRGLLRIRGRSDYRRAGAALGLPLEEEPDLAMQLPYAALVAGWLWQDRRVNVAADRGNIGMITRAITTRPGQMSIRHELYQAALMALEE